MYVNEADRKQWRHERFAYRLVFYSMSLGLMWIAHIHSGIYKYLTSSRGLCCKSIVIVISGNWEWKSGLLQQAFGISCNVITNCYCILSALTSSALHKNCNPLPFITFDEKKFDVLRMRILVILTELRMFHRDFYGVYSILDLRALLFCTCLAADAVKRGLWGREWVYNHWNACCKLSFVL